MLGYLFTFSLRDFLRPRRVFGWIFVIIALYGIAKLLWVLNRQPTAEKIYLDTANIFLFRVLGLACAIFSTAVISAEIEQKTIVYLLTRPIPRTGLILVRTMAAILSAALLGILAASVLSLATYGLSGFGKEYFYRDLLGVVVGAFAYTSFFTLLSLWINRSMIVSLLYVFGWESIVPNIPGDMRYLAISSHLEAITRRPSSGPTSNTVNALAGDAAFNTIPAGTAWMILVVATLACIAIAAIWFSNNEYLPREDAE